MSDLIDNEKVVAVFGPTNSGNAMAWKHIANQKKIPVLGNVGSGTDITKPMSPGADNYMFRVSMVDREQVAALMAYVKKNAAKSKVVGLMAETTGYGQGGLKDMEEIAAAAGHQAGGDRALRRRRHRHDLAAQQDEGCRRRHRRGLGAGHADRAADPQHGEDQLLPVDADLVGGRQHHLL